ncbi:MAG: 4-alpha-glucanotransferase [Halothiobacillaceae bacterium]
MMEGGESEILSHRRAGILLHPTSLPGGTLGDEAHRFVDRLAACGITLWQMLPLGPTHADGSPYQCLSSHAGSPSLISLERLRQEGWLEPSGIQCNCREDIVFWQCKA